MTHSKLNYTCRDCNDFYNCSHELEHNSVVCDYFVLRYQRANKVLTVGDIIRKHY